VIVHVRPSVEAPQPQPAHAPASGGSHASPSDEVAGLDGMRAIAALTVLVTHVSFVSNANNQPVLGGWFARMDAGVALFFLLSGFLLYRPFVTARLGLRPRVDAGTYLWRRALRIVPAYWLALTICVFVLGVGAIEGTRDAISFFLLGQIYDPARVVGGISQAWSLCTEVSFYLFLPAWAALMRRFGTGRLRVLRTEAIGLVTLAVLGLLTRWWALVTSWEHGGLVLLWLPASWWFFALGMGLALWRVAGDSGGRDGWTARSLDWSARHRGLWWLVAFACFALVAQGVGISRSLGDVTDADRMSEHLLYGLTAVALLIPVVARRPGAHGGRLGSFLTHPWMAWLGAISYGIYLWHKAWIEKVLQWSGMDAFAAHLGVMLVAVTAFSVGSAALSYHIVERPLLRLKRGRRLPGWFVPLGFAMIVVFAVLNLASFSPLLNPRPAPVAPPAPAPELAAPIVIDNEPPGRPSGTSTTVSRTTAPPPAVRDDVTVEAPLRVLLVGDSVMYDTALGIQRQLATTGLVSVRVKAGFGTGLTRDTFDWDGELAEQVDTFRPDLTVVLFGGWDRLDWERPDGTTLEVGTQEWANAYGAEVQQAIATLTSDGGRVLWLGFPVVEDPAAARSIDAVNSVYSQVATMTSGARFLPLSPILGNADGTYAAELPAGPFGDVVPVRKPDGVHPTQEGADLVGAAVLEIVRKDFGVG
jgi:peptidoglycan/LPS O-acetylase OafA/YrhL